MDLRDRPSLDRVFPPNLAARIVETLHHAAADTQGRAEDLRRPTVGSVYADLVFHGLKGVAADVGDELMSVDDKEMPFIYRVGPVRLIHYSVHELSDSYASNPGKRMVGEYLLNLAQPTLFGSDAACATRLDGHLAILATELGVVQCDEEAQVVLKHAFIGYPLQVSDSDTITSWADSPMVLTPLEVSTVTPERHDRLETIALRSDVTITSKKKRKGGS